MILIYLFTIKSQFIFSISFVVSFQKKKIIYIYCIKRIYYKILIWQQKLFLLVFTKKNEWIFTILFIKVFQFIFIYKKWLIQIIKKTINFFAKGILIKNKKDLNPLFKKKILLNPF